MAKKVVKRPAKKGPMKKVKLAMCKYCGHRHVPDKCDCGCY